MSKTILLVEDEAILALTTKRLLEQYGYAVKAVNSGEKAVEAVKTPSDIDLILMDINLGNGIDGTQAAEIILKNHDIPIVFVSSHTEPEIVEKTEKITSYGYVVKNSSITVLDASIKMAFKLFEANKETRIVNEKLEATFEALPDLIFEVGLDGYYYCSHSSHNELLYMPLHDLLGKKVSDVLPADTAATIMSAVAEAHEKGISSGKQYQLPVPAGMRSFEITVSRIVSFPDRPHFILLCRDITERRQLEDALEKRIMLLTSPLENSGSIAFTDLFNIDDIQKLQDDFSTATGVASIITQVDGTPITAPSNFCRLCSDVIRKTKLGNANCLKSDAALGRMNAKEPSIQPCFSSGLWDAGAGISVGGKHIANWLIGQVRDETQTEEKMAEYAKKIGVEETVFIEAFREVPAMAKDKFAKIANTLFRLANQLSTLAYQNVQQARMLSELKQTGIALQDQNEEIIKSRELLGQSEARLIQAEKAAKIGNWTLQLDTMTMIASKGADSIYGVDFENISLAEAQTIPLAEYRPLLDKALSDLVAKNIPYDLEFKIKRQEDGAIIDIHSIATFDHKTNTVFGVIQDITEQKKSKDLLQKNQERLNFALEVSGLAEWELNLKTNRVHRNECWAEMLGYSLSEIEDSFQQGVDLQHPDDREAVRKAVKDYHEGRTDSFKVAYRMRTKSGDYKWIQDCGKIVERDEVGKPLRLCGTQKDIDEEKKAENILEREKQRLKNVLIGTNAGTWEWNIQTGEDKIDEVSAALLGYTLDEFQAKTIDAWMKLKHPDDMRETNELLGKHIRGETEFYSFDSRMKHKNGTWVWLQGRGKVIEWDDSGKPLRMFGTHMDITERKTAEVALRDSEKKYKHLHESIRDGVVFVDLEGAITGSNGIFQNMVGYTGDELLTMNFRDITPEKWLAAEQKLISNQLDGKGYTDPYEKEYRRKDGSICPVELSLFALKDENSITSRFWAIVRDITERKKLETVLHDSEDKFSKIFKESPYPIMILDTENGCFTDLNEAMSSSSEYSREELIGKSAVELGIILPESELQTKRLIAETGYYSDFEVMIKTKSGKTRFGMATGRIIELNKHIYLIQTIVDITESKKAELALRESEEKYRILVENSSDPIFSFNPDGSYYFVNTAFSKPFGKSPEEIIGKKPHAIFSHEEAEKRLTLVRRVFQSGKKEEIEVTVDTKSDGKKYFLTMVDPIKDDQGTVIRVSCLSKDISERKIAEEKIKSLLAEKELILKEVHHRIKNNMSTISSLLSIQAHAITEPSAISALNDANRRIQSMTMLYDKLYLSAGFTEIAASDYLPDLVDEIIGNFPNAQNVAVEKNIDDFIINAKYLQPLGIIINELLTNTMKYAFVGRTDGLISVSATNTDRHVAITIQDDGSGIPQSVSFENSTGFGLQLVQALTQQLDGTIRIERGNGTKVVLEFEV